MDVAELRILAFCDYFSPQSSGGAERVAYEVYTRLARLGAKVSLIVTAHPGNAKQYEIDGVRVRSVPFLDLSRFTGAQVSLAPTALSEAARVSTEFQPHVLHANSLHFQTSVACAMLQLRTGRPMAITVHLAKPSYLPVPLRIATTAYEHSVGRVLLRRSSEVLAVSGAVARHARSLGARPERISVVPNGVDHQRFRPRHLERSSTRPLVLFVGRLISNKGPQVLVDAVRLLGGRMDLEVVFLGDGPLRADLERSIRGAGLESTIRFVGHASDVAVWLQRADVLVRPSFTEGLPLGVLEAMASRVCVIASAVPGNQELLESGRTGFLFPPGNVERLARQLERVLSDDDLRNDVASAGWEASKAYTWDACAQATARVLERAADRGTR